jgi:tetratricopeptide (TPR) repeat protein
MNKEKSVHWSIRLIFICWTTNLFGLTESAAVQALAALKKDDYNTVLRVANDAIRENPNDATAYCLRGEAYVHQRHFDKAAQELNKAIKLDPRMVAAHGIRGTAYVHLGEYEKAFSDYDTAVKLDPKDAQSYLGRGNVRSYKGDYSAAIRDYDEAIKLDPKGASAFINRAISHYALDQYQEASNDYGRALQINENSDNAHGSFAWLLATCPDARYRNGQRAVEHARKACELSKWKISGYWDTLAAAYAEVGDFDAAIRWEKKFTEDRGLTRARLNQAKARLDLYDAKKLYRKPRGKNPDLMPWN